jgi:hypothetical protein
MRRRGRKDQAGEYRAILELADAMHERLKEYGKEENDVPAFTEAGLRRRITNELRGGSISYATPLLPHRESYFGRDWRPWLERHRWSITTFVLCMILMAGAFTLSMVDWVVLNQGLFLIPLPLEWFIAFYLGASRRSCIVLFFWSFVVLSVVPQVTFAIVSHT